MLLGFESIFQNVWSKHQARVYYTLTERFWLRVWWKSKGEMLGRLKRRHVLSCHTRDLRSVSWGPTMRFGVRFESIIIGYKSCPSTSERIRNGARLSESRGSGTENTTSEHEQKKLPGELFKYGWSFQLLVISFEPSKWPRSVTTEICLSHLVYKLR